MATPPVMSSSPPPCSKAAAGGGGGGGGGAPGRYCLCAPTTHPGSFRCRLHRSPADAESAAAAVAPPSEADQEAAAAAVARAFLERVARKPRRQGARPGPSRLGGAAAAAATAMDN